MFRQACEAKHDAACFRLAVSELLEEPLATGQAVVRLGVLCERGVAGACTNLAWALEEGAVDGRKDEARAVALYERACEQGDIAACTNAAQMYRHGRGVVADVKKAFQLNERACAAADPRGCNNLGDMYESGIGVVSDLARAAELYRRTCEGENSTPPSADPCCERLRAADRARRHAFGCYSLGILHERGLSVERDPARARALFVRACSAGVQPACKRLQ